MPIPKPHYMVGSPKNTPPRGRVLFIAGHGMFLNGVMAQTDNANFDFSVNAVRWLTEPAEGKERRKALFFLDGTMVAKFDMSLAPPPPPIPMPTVRMLDRLIRGLEDERFFHRVLEDVVGDWLGRMVLILVALVSCGVLLYGAKKVMDGRVHVETAARSMIGAVTPWKADAPLEERAQARLRKTNFADEARQLALDWLRAEFDISADRWRPEVKAELVAQGLFWPPLKLRRQAAWVLGLARSAFPSVSRHQFFRLVEALRDLSEARKEGRLALLVEGKNVRLS